MASTFQKHAAERVVRKPGPLDFDHQSQRDWLGASEVLIGLLLGAIPPDKMDSILLEIEAERQDDPAAADRKAIILNYGLASDMPEFAKAAGVKRTLAEEVPDLELDKFLLDSKSVIGAIWKFANTPSRVELLEVLAMRTIEGSKLSAALLTLIRPELWADLGVWGDVRASPIIAHLLPSGGVLPVGASLMTYPSEGISSLVGNVISEIPSLRPSVEAYPQEWEASVREAVRLKRAGDYLRAAEIYIGLTRESRTSYLQIMRGLFKVVASAGYLAQALDLAVASAQEHVPHDREASRDWIQSGFRDVDAQIRTMASLMEPVAWEAHRAFYEDINDLLAATTLPYRLSSHLAMISGNRSYCPSRDYEVMVNELDQAVNRHEMSLGPSVAEWYRKQRRLAEHTKVNTIAFLATLTAPPSQSTHPRQDQASTSTGPTPLLVTGSSQAEPQKDLVVLGLGFIVVMLLVVIILLITEQGASAEQGDGIYTISANAWTDNGLAQG